jgi:hypothetical protein
LNCKLTEKWIFQPEAPDDGDGAAASIIEEELAGVGEIADAKAQADPSMEEEHCIVERNFCKKYFGLFESSYILRYGLSFFCEYTSQY